MQGGNDPAEKPQLLRENPSMTSAPALKLVLLFPDGPERPLVVGAAPAGRVLSGLTLTSHCASWDSNTGLCPRSSRS